MLQCKNYRPGFGMGLAICFRPNQLKFVGFVAKFRTWCDAPSNDASTADIGKKWP
jgi:hypothetical protein